MLALLANNMVEVEEVEGVEDREVEESTARAFKEIARLEIQMAPSQNLWAGAVAWHSDLLLNSDPSQMTHTSASSSAHHMLSDNRPACNLEAWQVSHPMRVGMC